jgi:adenine-specific DNA-methyltransferase
MRRIKIFGDPKKLKRTGEQLSYYKNPDMILKENGILQHTHVIKADERPNLYYPIVNPNTMEEVWPKETAVWKYSKDITEKYINEKTFILGN